jgi:pectinesterase
VVAKDGSGNYTTVQAAVNAAAAGDTIYIKNGKYKEKITIASGKTSLKMIGESVANVILTYDDYASKMVTCNTTVGTQNSASFTVNANDFTAINITFENNFGDGSQAVAVLVNADRAVFKNCRFLANQDTLYLKGSGTPKAYFKKCYIDGNVDFIFGSSIALFDSCVIYAKTRPSTSASYITAPNTPNGQAYGFVFRDALLPMNTGTTLYYLSRPWPSPDVPNTRQKCIFLSSVLSSHIQPAGWSIWDANTVTSNLTYAEYASKYFDGTPADVSQRVAWSSQLTQTDSSTYTFSNMFGAWDPCAVYSGLCNPSATAIAVSNFRGTKGGSSSTFNWNISWPISGIQYDLYRSTDGISYSSIYSTTATNDTAVNFSYTDNTVPPTGSIYYYYVAASKAGYATHITDTIQISNAAQIIVNASSALSLCGFSQALGTPSANQTYTIAGSNLTGNISITPPVNFEVSSNNSTWFTNASPLLLTPVSGTVATTTIYVRLNAGAIGSYSGNIVNTSAGVTSINVPVSGNTFAAPTSVVMKQWPLLTGNADSAAVRSAAVTGSNSSLNLLFTSDGSATSANIPGYSSQYGQALGANAAGNNWSAVGGTLKRDYYEQFTITAAAGYSVRLDSITFLTDFYLTASAIKAAVVYSKNGFSAPADSTEITSATLNGGTSLTLSASGNFTKSFPLLRSDAGAVNYYSVALNGATGVSLNAGETLTIRLYWACSSTGTPRFAFLKNVKIMGVVTSPLPVNLLSFNASLIDKKVKLNWVTENEINTKHFDIERSADGNNFLTIGNVRAKNIAGKNEYMITDANPLSGVSFYRLKITDRDGSFSYSQIIAVNNKKEAGLKIFPNPVTDNLFVTHAKAVTGAKLELYAIDGRKITEYKVTTAAVQTNVNTSTLAKGNYNLVFVNGAEVKFIQLIKK